METLDAVKNLTVEIGDKRIEVYDTSITIRDVTSYSSDASLSFSREQFKKILAVIKVALE